MDRGLWDGSLILFILGLASLVGGRLLELRSSRKNRMYGFARARVVSLVMRETEGHFRARYDPVIEYYAEGKLCKILYKDDTRRRWELGQEIPIVYDVRQPTKMWIEEKDFSRHFPMLMYTAGIAMILLAVFLFVRFAARG